MRTDDPEYAFPLPVTEHNPGFPGMTLHDYFAAQALPACIEKTLHVGTSYEMRDLQRAADLAKSAATFMLIGRPK